MSPLRGSRSNGRRLPTARAVGYEYFVGFANWLTLNFDKRAFQVTRYTRDAIQQIVGRERRKRERNDERGMMNDE
jgi:hypothetical protein